MRIRRSFLKLVVASLFLGAPAWAWSEDYPTKPVKIIAGFPPGGAADLLARLLGERLSAALGQPFVIENRPGAGGTIGAAAVAKSPADGYTLLLGVTASQTIAPSIYKSLPYDAAKDFQPVNLVAAIPVAFVVHPSVSANTPKDFVALAKQAATPLAVASSGSGTIPHLTAELFQLTTGVKMDHVPYKGASPAMTDLLGSRVQLMFDHLPTVLPHIRAGKLRAIGIAGTQRARALPELPTLAEQGIPGMEVSSWFGVLAPAGTPEPVVALLNREIVKILAADTAKARLEAMGAEPVGTPPQEFARIIRADTEKWAKLVKLTGARAD